MQVYIEVSPDFVKIEGQVVKRPEGMARSVWLKFWEQVCGGYSHSAD